MKAHKEFIGTAANSCSVPLSSVLVQITPQTIHVTVHISDETRIFARSGETSSPASAKIARRDDLLVPWHSQPGTAPEGSWSKPNLNVAVALLSLEGHEKKSS